MHLTDFGIVAATYLIPRVIRHLTSWPANNDDSFWGNLRRELYPKKESLKASINRVNDKVWFCASEILGRNGWIATFALLAMYRYFPPKPIALIPHANMSAFLSNGVLILERGSVLFCMFTGIIGIAIPIRFVVAHYSPRIASFL